MQDLSGRNPFCYSNSNVSEKGKGVPLHAKEAHGGRGGITPTHI
jgi:hypothetical protein